MTPSIRCTFSDISERDMDLLFLEEFICSNTFLGLFIKQVGISNARILEMHGYIDFDSLTLVEQKTLHLSWLMAQIYYHVLATPLLDTNGEVSDDARLVYNTSAKDLKQVRRDAYKMTGDNAVVGNLVWQPVANKMLIINFAAVAVFIIAGILSMGTSTLKGALLIICAAVAFPIFIKFRNLPASRLYVWRLLRLVIAVLMAIAVVVFL